MAIIAVTNKTLNNFIYSYRIKGQFLDYNNYDSNGYLLDENGFVVFSDGTDGNFTWVPPDNSLDEVFEEQEFTQTITVTSNAYNITAVRAKLYYHGLMAPHRMAACYYCNRSR